MLHSESHTWRAFLVKVIFSLLCKSGIKGTNCLIFLVSAALHKVCGMMSQVLEEPFRVKVSYSAPRKATACSLSGFPSKLPVSYQTLATKYN